MDDQRLGAAVRAVRLRRKLRQQDVAALADVSRSTISLVERGHLGTLSLTTVRRIAAALDIRVDLVPRWRGGDLDRLLSRRHSRLAEGFAAHLARSPGWVLAPEVSFSIFGERGFVDLMGWHAGCAHLLVLEFKTELVDVNELLGTIDRKQRLARRIAAERGWRPERISPWLVVADTSTNRHHVHEHSTLLKTRFPLDGRHLRRLLGDPTSAGSGLAFWSDSNGGSARPTYPARPGRNRSETPTAERAPSVRITLGSAYRTG